MNTWPRIHKLLLYFCTLLFMSTCSVERLGNQVLQQDGDDDSRCFYSTIPIVTADCSDRGLLNIPNNLSPNLEYLDLSGNHIASLNAEHFKKLTKLRTLKLNNNHISIIKGAVFKELMYLEYLDLSGNDISILHNEVFIGLINLKLLLLDRNNITIISRNAFKELSSLRQISLASNQLYCSCEVIWLAEWLEEQRFNMNNGLNQIHCYEPASKRHTKLSEFNTLLDVKLKCHQSSRQQHRVRRSASLTHWSCVAIGNNLHVVSLDTVSTTVDSLHSCMLMCQSVSDTYGAISGTTCLCGNKNSRINRAYRNCNFNCPGSSACAPYIGESDLMNVQTYLANYVPPTSTALATNLATQSTIRTSSAIQTTSTLQTSVASTSSISSSSVASTSVASTTLAPTLTSSSSISSSSVASTSVASTTLAPTLTPSSSISSSSVTSTSVASTTLAPTLTSSSSSSSSSVASTSVASTTLVPTHTSSSTSSSNSVASTSVASTTLAPTLTSSSSSSSSSVASTSVASAPFYTSLDESSMQESTRNEEDLDTEIDMKDEATNSITTSLPPFSLTTSAYIDSTITTDDALPMDMTTRFQPSKSSSVTIKMTTAVSQNNHVVVRIRRASSDVSTIRQLTANPTTTDLSAHGIQLITTEDSPADSSILSEISVYLRYIADGIENSMLYKKINNSLTFKQNKIIVINQNTSVAVPLNTSIEIIVILPFANMDNLSVSLSYDDISTNRSMVACNDLVCSSNNNKSRASKFSVTFQERTSKNLSMTINGLRQTISAQVYLNMTVLDVMRSMPQMITNQSTYIARSASILSAFMTSHKLVEGLWTIRNSSNAIVLENQSHCVSQCSGQLSSNPNCLQPANDTCFVWQEYSIDTSGTYTLTVEFSNPVTRVFPSRTYNISVERAISDVTITSCDFFANVNEHKFFSVEYKGDNAHIEWYVNGQRNQQSSSSFNHTFKTTNVYNVSVRVYNNVSRIIKNASVTVIEWGSVHGLSIIKPTDLYHATKRELNLQAKLCDGDSAQLTWTFGDGTILTTNSTSVQHTFVNPQSYTIHVKAWNVIQNKTENTTKTLVLQDEIKNFTAYTAKSTVAVNEKFRIYVSVIYGTDVKYKYKTNGKKAVKFTANKTDDISVSSAGTVSYTVYAENKVSKSEKEITIKVEEVIDVTIDSHIYLKTGHNVTLRANRIAGSDMSVHWDFGDGTRAGPIYPDQSVQIQHLYANEGRYTLELNVTNAVSSVSLSSTVIVQRPLSVTGNNLTVTTAQNIVATNESVIISISVEHVSIYGYNISDAATFLLLNRTNYVSKSFASAGSYTLNFIASNQVSRIDQSVLVIVQDRISGQISLSPLYVPVNIPQMLNATVRGTQPTFNFTFPNGDKATGNSVAYNFTQLGYSTVKATASNKVSSITSNIVVHVEVFIRELWLISNVTVATTDKTVKLQTSLGYRPEHQYTWSISNVPLSHSSNVLSWTFPKPGLYLVSLKAENHVSSGTASVIIEVEESISGVAFSIESSQSPHIVPFNESVTIQPSVATGSNLTYTWSSDYPLQNNSSSLLTLVVDNDRVHFVRVSLTVSNKISNAAFSYRFPVIRRISEVTIVANATTTVPNAIVKMWTVYRAGSNISTNWSVNGIYVSASNELYHKFPKAATYNISVVVSNALDTRQASVIIIIQDPFEFVRMHPLITATNVTTEFSVTAAQGTEPEYYWKIPDGVLSSTSSSQTSKTKNLTFPRDGIYTVIITSTNLVHNVSTSFHVTVQDKISGLKIVHDRTSYPTHAIFSFIATTYKGSNVSFDWTVKTNNIAVSKYNNSKRIEHVFVTAGVYEIMVTATNKVNSLAKSIQVYAQNMAYVSSINSAFAMVLPIKQNISLTAGLNGTNLTTNFNVTGNAVYSKTGLSSVQLFISKTGPVNVTVTASNKVSLAVRTFAFHAQERLAGLSIWASGSLVPTGLDVEFKAILKLGTHVSFTWSINSTTVNGKRKSFQHNFKTSGLYKVKVVAQNQLIFPPLESHVMVQVVQPNCEAPTVAILGGKERTVMQTQWLYAEASVEYNCSGSSVSSRWHIKIANSTTNCIVEETELESFIFSSEFASSVNLQSPSLIVPPKALSLGYYCVVYTAAFGRDGRFKIVDAQHLKVRSMPLEPAIIGGTERIVGWNQSFSLEASSQTSPTLPAGLLYRWTCVARPWNTSVDVQAPGCGNTTEDTIGRVLHVKAGTLDVKASYEFALYVRHLTGAPVHRMQKIYVVEGKVVEASIQCITCQIYNVMKYVRNRVLKIQGKCNNCFVAGKTLFVQYRWRLMATNGSVLDFPMQNSTERSSILVIKENTLDGVNAYKIALNVSVTAPSLGPRNGSCELLPKSGPSLQTLFTYSCKNWKDGDNSNMPLIYWLVALNRDSSRSILYRGIKNENSMFLPIGEKAYNNSLHLQILVENAFGVVAVGMQRAINVYPPITDNLGNFLEDKVVSKMSEMLQENDMSKVITASQASAKLLSYTKMGTQEQHIISNITKYTSQLSPSTIESVEQLSTELKFSLNLVPESAVANDTRHYMTRVLQDMVDKTSNWAASGQLGSDAAINALLFLTQNNIAAESVATTSSENGGNARKRRAVSQRVSSLEANLNMVMRIYTSVLRASLRGEKAKQFLTKYGTAILKRSAATKLSNVLSANGCTFEVQGFSPAYPDIFQIFNTSFSNPHAKLSGIASPVAGLSYSTPAGREILVKDLPSNNQIVIKLNTTRPMPYQKLNKIVSPNSFAEGELIINIPVENSSLFRVDFVFNSIQTNMTDVYLKPGSMPTDLDTMYRLNQTATGLSSVSKPGEFNTSTKHFIRIRNRDNTDTLNMTIIVYTVSCQFWNRSRKIWDTSGCLPSEESSWNMTVCHCSHLTSFASAFTIAPNPIKWATLLELDIEKNPIALSVCLALIIIYLITVFFASRKDETDRREAHFIPMIGSDEFFKYEIRIKTGVFPYAGTTANVGVKIFGTKCTTKPIVLTKEHCFHRNSIEFFRFASATRLGKITRVQIWHNNAGSNPSWFLSRVVIKNLLSGEKFFFFCNRWLAVDREDGAIDRYFEVADEKMMTRFTTIFNDVIGRTFTDYHLWISLFEKPKMSRFSRVQRLTCCVTFLLSWMCIDAMWYGTAKEGQVDLYLGFKGYSYEEVIIGAISSLMVFPVNMIFILIFKNSRMPHSKQILDGEEEVTIHILPSRHTRRLSEDWVEIEDNRASGSQATLLSATSLPRCGGVFRLNSMYQQMAPVHALPNDNIIELENGDQEAYDSHDINAEVKHGARRQGSEITYVQSDAYEVTEGPSFLARFPRLNSKQYKEMPSIQCLPKDYEDDEEDVFRNSTDEQETYDKRPILANEFIGGELEPRKPTFHERTLVSMLNELKKRPGNGYETAPGPSKNHDFNDSLSSKQSSFVTNSSLARTLSEPRFNNRVFQSPPNNKSRDIPDIREYDARLDWSLPSGFVIVAYCGCFAISVLSIVVILIYGQQFGKDKAVKWVVSLFSGIFQDIFITYPIVLIVVAVVIALFRKPMNLDYSDFVMSHVVRGDSSATSKPLSGYALEIAQRQGKNRRKLRKLLQNCFFQFIHLWMISSICITSYDTHMVITTDNFKSRLDTGSSGYTSVQSVGQLWSWTENILPNVLYPNKQEADSWFLRSVPRIRQIRVRSRACIPASSAVQSVTTNRTCAPDYKNDQQETGEYSSGWNTPSKSLPGSSPWKFVAERDLNGSDFLGEFSTYPHSGYIVLLPDNRPSFLARIRSLKSAGWLDAQTRVVFVEFTTQNFNLNKYATITILFEISTTGAILPHLDVLYTRIHMYTRSIDYFRLFCEVIFALIAVYLVWHLMHRIAKRKWKLFCKFWDVHLILVCIMSLTVVALYIYRLVIFLKIQWYIKTGLLQGNELRREALIDWAAQACMGFLSFLVICKVITLFSISKSYNLVASTLSGSVRHFFAVFTVLAIFLLAFSSWGYLAFGSVNYVFHSFWRSLVYTSLIRIWSEADSTMNATNNNDQFAAWSMLHVFMLLCIIIPLFRAVLCTAYKEARLDFFANRRREHKDFTNHLFNVISRNRIRKKKHVKFNTHTPMQRRSTMATSQQTISLGSDPGFPSQMPWLSSRMPPVMREKLLSRLNPRTDAILSYVYQLEQDEYLEDEFLGKLESMATHHEISDKRF
eukprot:gene8787-9725_t